MAAEKPLTTEKGDNDNCSDRVAAHKKGKYEYAT